jgi:RNA polymerase sigma-70 factor (ECF subfamily)
MSAAPDLACLESPSRAEALALAADLHRTYHRRLVRLCVRHLGDPALAEDIAQDTILRAIRFLPTYDVDRPIWPWLATIATRLCTDAALRRQWEESVPEVPDESDPRHEADSAVERLHVSLALAELPQRQREALQLRYLDDCDRVTAARLLGVTANAFDQLLWRARVRLHERLKVTQAGASGIVLTVPLRWLRRKLRTAGGPLTSMASTAAVVLPLAATSLAVVVAGGVTPLDAGRARLDSVSAATTHPVAAKPDGIATRTHSAPARRSRVQAASAADPSTRASVSLTPTPFAPGRQEEHHLTVPTPYGTVTVKGYTNRSPGAGLVCSLPGVACVH